MVLHPIVLVDRMVCLTAAGLLVGQQKSLAVHAGALAMSGGIAAGIGLQLVVPPSGLQWNLLLIAAAAAGLLIAAAPVLGRSAVAAAVLMLGLPVGLNTFPETPRDLDVAYAVAGALVAGALVTSIVGWAAAKATPEWAQIGVRVVAAWIAAASIMVLALTLPYAL